MAWYLNPALTRMRAEVNERWPHRDRGSDGTVGDLAHQASVSDHNPDRDGSVDAWDMDVELNGPGRAYRADVEKVIASFEKHEAARYWIFDGQIANRSDGWKRWKYTGSNPHDKHVHFNTRENYENSTKPWGIKETGMSWTENLPDTPSTVQRFGTGPHQAQTYLKLAAIFAYDANRANAKIDALIAVVEELSAAVAAGGGNVDTAAILAGVDERVDQLEDRLSVGARAQAAALDSDEPAVP